MAEVRFLTGSIENLPEEKKQGQIYFAISDSDNSIGQIFFDKDDNTRYTMSSPINNCCFAICNSVSDIARKKCVLLKEFDNWKLLPGSFVFINFLSTNLAENPSFAFYKSNDEELIVKVPQIFYKNKKIETEDLEKAGESNTMLQFVYDGTNLHYMNKLGAKEGSGSEIVPPSKNCVLTIGEYTYDGSKDVIIPTYKGEYNR